MNLPDHRHVLDFWFGELDGLGRAAPDISKRWWQKDPEFDRSLREKFGSLHAHLLGGGFREWRHTAPSLLAYVIVLDQLSRNMFRDTASMYVGDELALSAALEGIALGFAAELPRDMRVFLYMPLMHSERIEVQRRCVDLFVEFAATAGDDVAAIEWNLDFARRHLVIVERFGRFPHRNLLLGRPSSPEELEFLAQPGSSF